MAKSITMTVRLKPEVSERLGMLPRDTKRSKAYLASEAIEAYVELNSWQVAHIKRALEEDESSVPGVPASTGNPAPAVGGPTAAGKTPS